MGRSSRRAAAERQQNAVVRREADAPRSRRGPLKGGPDRMRRGTSCCDTLMRAGALRDDAPDRIRTCDLLLRRHSENWALRARISRWTAEIRALRPAPLPAPMRLDQARSVSLWAPV